MPASAWRAETCADGRYGAPSGVRAPALRIAGPDILPPRLRLCPRTALEATGPTRPTSTFITCTRALEGRHVRGEKVLPAALSASRNELTCNVRALTTSAIGCPASERASSMYGQGNHKRTAPRGTAAHKIRAMGVDLCPVGPQLLCEERQFIPACRERRELCALSPPG